MLDLTLDHLGLMTQTSEVNADSNSEVKKGLAALVERVGVELQHLSSPACLTPKQKSDALIRAHKIVVGESLCIYLVSCAQSLYRR